MFQPSELVGAIRAFTGGANDAGHFKIEKVFIVFHPELCSECVGCGIFRMVSEIYASFLRFPALNLAIGSMRTGGMAPTVLNAANEITRCRPSWTGGSASWTFRAW